MRRLIRHALTATVATMAVVFAAPALLARATAGARAAHDPRVDTVRTAWNDYGRRMNARDFDGALNYYADDPRFLWIDRGVVVAHSRADIAKGYAKFPAMGPMKYTYGTPQIIMLGRDAAVMMTTFDVEMGTAAAPVKFGGIMTITWIRTSSGWKFLVGHA